MKYFIFLFLFAFLGFTNCFNKKKPKKILYSGHVYDSLGGAPSSGIRVLVTACVPRDARYYCTANDLASSTTDANGFFKMEFMSATSEKYFIDYKSKHVSVPSGDFNNSQMTTLYLYH